MQPGPNPPDAVLPRWLGWLMLAPAAVLLVLFYLVPTGQLLAAALADIGEAGAEFWEFAFSNVYRSQLGYALSFALLPLLILATVAPAFAWSASRAGRAGRWVARAALALPLAAFAPAGLALHWLSRQSWEGSPDTWTTMDTRLVAVVTLGGFLVAVPVTCFLAALRRQEPGARTWLAMAAVGAVLALAAVGVALQQYTFVAVLNGQPYSRDTGSTPMNLVAAVGLDGVGPVVPVTLLPILAGLGIVAAVVMLASGLRVEFDPVARSADDTRAPAATRTAALLGVAAGVAAMAAFIVFQLGPWLSDVAAAEGELPDGFAAGAVLSHTWLLPLGTSIIQVGAGALAAFGIVVARPIGRGSEWLLLAFAPWLLVGNGLLAAARVDPEAEGLQPLLAYAPPSWLSIPALFVFALLFRGQAAVWWRLRATGRSYSFFRAMWPVLPMLVLVTGVAWLVQAQDLIVAAMADRGQGVVPNGQLVVVRPAAAIPLLDPDAINVAAGYPLALLVLFTLGALVLQVAYLDRIAIRAGQAGPPARPPAGQGVWTGVPHAHWPPQPLARIPEPPRAPW